MTINELRQAPAGTKQYLDAQLLVIGLAKMINLPRGPRNVQELQVIDRQGVTEKIAYWFDTDKPDFQMAPAQINQWIVWQVTTKPKGNYLNISGWPTKVAQAPGGTPQQPAPAYNPPPQVPAPAINSTPPQRMTSEWDKPVDWHDNKQLLIVRQSSLSNAIALAKISDMEHPTIDNILTTAEKFAYFVYHGIQDDLDKALAQGGQPNPEYSENPDSPAPGDKF